ncbi:MAG: HAD family hydrolase [Lachnospiraceae bacterium]|nr:HAD family hydrolase [Lachnospiraceae bacterium]
MHPILVFDYDGTLHETMRVYRPAIEYIVHWLVCVHGVEVQMPSDERIRSWLGMSTAQMWEDFLPQLPARLKEEAGSRVGRFMNREIRAGNGRWYPRVRQRLDALKAEGYVMTVLSNCDREYALLNWEVFGMERWFTAFWDCGSYGWISKADVLERIAGNFRGEAERAAARCGEPLLSERLCAADPGNGFTVIGDRYSDREAAERIGASFCGCSYGYGTPEEIQSSAFSSVWTNGMI